MIPASLVLVPSQLDISDGGGGDAAGSDGSDPNSGFAAALFGVMEAAKDATAEPDPVAVNAANTEGTAANSADSVDALLAATEALGAGPISPVPGGTGVPSPPARWLAPAVGTGQPWTDQPAPGTRSTQSEQGRAATELASEQLDFEIDGDVDIAGDADLPAAQDAARVPGNAIAANTDSTHATERSSSAADPATVDIHRSHGPTGLEPASRAAPDAPARVQPPPVQAPLHTPQWSQEFAARVTWVVDSGDQLASIRLNPEELGPVEVRVAIREGEASIWFGATHPDTRVAIEQALPRLREMLAASGLSLADSGVYREAPREPRQGFTRADARRAGVESTVGSTTQSVDIIRSGLRSGLIDDYA